MIVMVKILVPWVWILGQMLNSFYRFNTDSKGAYSGILCHALIIKGIKGYFFGRIRILFPNFHCRAGSIAICIKKFKGDKYWMKILFKKLVSKNVNSFGKIVLNDENFIVSITIIVYYSGCFMKTVP